MTPQSSPVTSEMTTASWRPEMPGQRHKAGRTVGVTAPTAPVREFRQDGLVIGLGEMTDLDGRQSLAAFSGVTQYVEHGVRWESLALTESR